MRRIAIAFGIVVGAIVLWLAFGTRTSESTNRKIAADLVELHRQWDTHSNIPSLFQTLTNLPFHDSAVGVGDGSVERRYGVLGIKWKQCYFIYQPQPTSNASEWTLYHAWYWYPPKGGRKQLAIRKLLTMTTN